jgi:starvation-inducible outer membrane lipoprotein
MNPNKHEIYQILIIGLLAGGLTACATSPTRSKSARADHTASFAKAYENPEDYQHARVLWGGEIQSVVANSTNGAEFMIKEMPLFGAGKAPIYGGKSQGTFTARSYSDFDPTLFQPGEVITLTGDIVGHGPTGPEVQIDTVKFWKLQREPNLSDDPMYTDDFPFGTRNEPVAGWTHQYVLDKEKTQRVTEGHLPALTINP